MDDIKFYGGFNKMFGQMTLDSWITKSGDSELRGVWEDLLKICDPKGFIRADYPAIAMRINRPMDIVISKMAVLGAPHRESRSQHCDGRSIVQIVPGTWKIVNYERYRAGGRDVEERKTYKARKMREYRARDREKQQRGQSTERGQQRGQSVDSRGQSVDNEIEISQEKRGQGVDQRGPIQSQSKSTPQTPQGGLRRNLFLGLDFDEEKKRPADPDEEPTGWTEQLLKAANLAYPDADFPAKFAQMPVDIQREIEAVAKKLPG